MVGCGGLGRGFWKFLSNYIDPLPPCPPLNNNPHLDKKGSLSMCNLSLVIPLSPRYYMLHVDRLYFVGVLVGVGKRVCVVVIVGVLVLVGVPVAVALAVGVTLEVAGAPVTSKSPTTLGSMPTKICT